jgi:hypothetical protein
VQLFFNFDTAVYSTNIGKQLVSKNTVAKPSQQKLIIAKKNSNDRKVSGFRLNKRYQPATAAICKTIIIKPVVCSVSSKQHVHYCSGFIPASLPPVHSLRGPPVVA